MNKILIAGVMCLMTGAGYAATRCVALEAETTTCRGSGSANGEVDWTATCTTGDIETEITGIAVCSSISGTTQFETRDTLNQSYENGAVHCWCRMISPAISSWVYYMNLDDECDDGCSYRCGDVGFWNMAGVYQRALLGSIKVQ